ncbi:ABC transporter ATP-binding protein [Catellatospora sp. KI3]|uniref:ABC transporter ATP-binding protein n=1 Tax=Catellatospora sp. KI3 TaxID=3041620 RepID=UPI002482572C|nr:ABC transporter ATP-binding protein [Catellatospora sp. KI3]MDI1463930.1 ABC transporter ATP-binding protein [Catellatospora sp. KI3]
MDLQADAMSLAGGGPMGLELEDVRVTYPDGDRRLTALAGVTLRVAPGELVSVLGPSGSGKSSLLAVAGLLLTPDGGRVRIGGVEAAGLRGGARDRLRRERIGFVFQQANLLPSLTALDQLLLSAHIRGESVRSARGRAERLLERVGLAARRDRRPHQLSGGERQRVGIARALLGRPRVLLLDEPTSALDHERGVDVVELIRAVTAEHGVASLLVTHDQAHARRADRAVVLRDGGLC